MRSKTITVNNNAISVAHEVTTRDDHQTVIKLSARHAASKTTVEHRFTIGSVEGLPAGYGAEQLQKDFDAARQKLAELCESRARGKKLAKELV
jgi:hypothetical protein